MWNEPWTRDLLSRRPLVDGVSFADGVDLLRGVWEEDQLAMIVTLNRWQNEPQSVMLYIRNPSAGEWITYVSGEVRQRTVLSSSGDLRVAEIVGLDEMNVVVQHTEWASDGWTC